MEQVSMHRIKAVIPKPGYRLNVQWEKGGSSIIDLSSTISIGGVFAELSDNSAFSKVRIGEHQRTVEWPKPSDAEGYPIITIDAEALLVMAEDQQNASLAASMRRIWESASKITHKLTPVSAALRPKRAPQA